MIKSIILSVSAIISFTAYSPAQTLRYPNSMPYLHSGAYSNRYAAVFSFTSNQASLASISAFSAGLYGERRFMIAENSYYAVAAALPTSLGNFGLQFNYGGYKNFNENKLGLAYARMLGSKTAVGIQFNYYGYRIPSYGNASTLNAEAGVIFHITEKLGLGVHVYNPVAGKLGKNSGEKLASAFTFGAGYDASESFYAGMEIMKEEDKPVNITAGVQYRYRKQFFLQAGIVSETSGGYAGAGFSWKNMRLDLAVNYHPQLGFSPGLLLTTNFKMKKKN